MAYNLYNNNKYTYINKKHIKTPYLLQTNVNKHNNTPNKC